MRVRIDYQRCVGHARCIALCPAVFSSDDLGRAQVRVSGEVPEKEIGNVRDAAQSCPEAAVILEPGPNEASGQ